MIPGSFERLHHRELSQRHGLVLQGDLFHSILWPVCLRSTPLNELCIPHTSERAFTEVTAVHQIED